MTRRLACHDVRVFYDHRQKWPEAIARSLGVADGQLLCGFGRIFLHQNSLSGTVVEAQLVAPIVNRRVHIGVFHWLRSRALDTDGRNIFVRGS